MDLRAFYMLHCLADSDFYETVARVDDHATRFALLMDVPSGWRRFEGGLWVTFRPSESELPVQGWKIHVSASLDNADAVLETVWEYCVRNRVAFKVLRSRDVLLITNSKYADRGSSGKFCTLYPVGDEALERTLTDLSVALAGQRGPYILSDLRYGDGPLYVRYGGVTLQYCPSETGAMVPALATPDGRLVPDVRRPGFQIPAGVALPAVLVDQLPTGGTAPPPDFHYRVEKVLHFSNGGGVYLAEDTRSGQRVVLKEARPLAGFDTDGQDAVARLARERAMLERLTGVDVVPALLGHVRCGEHEFLVQEHIDGDPLTRAVAARHPLAHPDPADHEIAAYTTWALDVLDRVEEAMAALHARGVVHGDLHPTNIIVRPDGRIALTDFEVASHIDEHRRPSLGAPGFVAPTERTGFGIDRFALGCTRLWTFLPFAPSLVARDGTKAETFIGVLTDRFGVPARRAAQLLAELRATEDNGPRSRPAGITLFDTAEPDWRAVRGSMVEAILASATPDRTDRIFPGDVHQLRYGGLGLAYGAAGVLYALATVGAEIPPEHVDWLVRATTHAEHPPVGLYSGLHGVAFLLEHIGRVDEAMTILDRAQETSGDLPARGLFGGSAGIGLNLLHFGRTIGDRSLRAGAVDVAEQLARSVHDPAAGPDLPSAAGLMYGFSGAALLFLHLYDDTADATFLDLAAAAIRRDLDYCELDDRGRLQVHEGHRLMPYLAIGSAGMGMVLTRYLDRRPDDELALSQAQLRRACHAEALLFPGLFTGNAGMIAFLSRERDSDEGRTASAVRMRLRQLAWHAMPYGGHLAFPGDQLMRLSMDLATGSAGVLLALCSALDESTAFLPFLAPQPGAVTAAAHAGVVAANRAQA